MKNIRSKSIAALSIVLLLSTASARTMEFTSTADTQVETTTPKVSWSFQGVAKSAGNGIVSAASKTKDGFVAAGSYVADKTNAAASALKNAAQNAYSATPTLSEAKSAIVDFAKERPATAAVIAVPVVAGAGYLAYKAAKAVANKVQAQKAESKKIADVLASANSVAKAIVDNIAAQANKVDVKLLVKPVVEFAVSLPKESAYRKAFAQFVKAAIEVDVKSKDVEAQVEAFTTALKALNEMYSVKAKLAKLVPTKKTAALVAGVAAIPAGYYAYQNGYAATAGEAIVNSATNLVNAVKNVNYSAVKNVDVVTPVTNFAKDHKVALGIGAGAAGIYGSAYGVNKFVNYKKNQFAKATALKPAPELKPELKHA